MSATIRCLAPMLLVAAAPAAAQDDGHDAPHHAQGTGLPDGAHSEMAASAAPTPAAAPAQAAEAGPPPLLPNRGNGGFPITTSVPQAQAYFDNGIALAMAFDHAEAIAAMAEAVRLDPQCAMCRWGHAFTLGPTINYGKTMEERAEPHRVARDAKALAKANGTPLERALIDALIERYRSHGDEAARDAAYFEAMKRVAAAHPEHDTAQVLAADAAFAGGGEDFVALMQYAIDVLEPVLARTPDHTPAIHFYIHATEIYGEPGKAEEAADRLDAMRLEASHLAHMPSHTWYWVGRYADAADANRRAVIVDHRHASHGAGGGDVWELPYHAHNIIFGLGGALMADDSRTALMLARPLVAYVETAAEGRPYRELLAAAGYFALGRFEDPQKVLEVAEPKAPYLKAAWHYARGEAHAFLGDTAGVKAEMDAIPERIGEPPTDGEEDTGLGPPQQMLTITRAVLRGRLATLEGRHQDAAAAFAEGAQVEETEDFQRFTDPPAFWYPVRRDLARALWAAGDREGALREAEKTLEVRPLDPGTLSLIHEIGKHDEVDLATAPLSVDRDHPVDRAPLGGADQVVVRDLDRVEHGLDLAAPEGKEAIQLGEARRDVVLLEHEGLQQARVVGEEVVDMDGGQAVAFQLASESEVTRTRHLPSLGRTAIRRRLLQLKCFRQVKKCCNAACDGGIHLQRGRCTISFAFAGAQFLRFRG